MADSMTHRYIPRIEQREENLFTEEYYSSTDTKIYIDDIEQTEISYISYSLQEQLKPIYGYASNTFDDVAIGNRIVTGVLKIPIKNPNAQTSKEDIKEQKQTTSTIEDYNQKEENIKDSVDWITGNDTITNKIETTLDDDTFAYVTKLESLGYKVSYDSDRYIIKEQIKQFQIDNNLNPDGILTASTKQAIDNAINNSKLKTMELKTGQYLYFQPRDSSDYEILESVSVVYIISDEYDLGWKQVMLPDGRTRFVK